MNYVLKNFKIEKNLLREIDDSSEEFSLIKLATPWDTYIKSAKYHEIEDVYLGVYLDISQVFLLIDTGEDLIKTDDWTPTVAEKQMIKVYVEDFYENDNQKSELLRECI